jgi:hypothetical protein
MNLKELIGVWKGGQRLLGEVEGNGSKVEQCLFCLRS